MDVLIEMIYAELYFKSWRPRSARLKASDLWDFNVEVLEQTCEDQSTVAHKIESTQTNAFGIEEIRGQHA